MRYLLDTNVLSEPARPHPNERVVTWLRAQTAVDLAVSVLTLGEIQKGISRLPAGERRERLEDWLILEVPRRFEGRLLGIDQDVAREWGRLSAVGLDQGRPLPVVDGLLLATAAVHELTFVTRDERDCAGRGVTLLNPWEA